MNFYLRHFIEIKYCWTLDFSGNFYAIFSKFLLDKHHLEFMYVNSVFMIDTSGYILDEGGFDRVKLGFIREIKAHNKCLR